MRELPTGTVTFLFTDIEGSTRLLSELGDRYEDVLAEHHRVIREAVERHGGIEVDTQGDAFFVAFSRASDAVAAAADAQAALAAGPVRVRMGLHTGEPRTTNQGYIGIDVVRAARIGNAANGGQVVISPATCQLLDSDVEVRDLGEHRLKDFPAATRLFQLGTAEFPPLRTPDEARLPLVPTQLVGRQKELADAVRLLANDRARLLTVTGPGGVGKTRFAVEVATESMSAFTDGARFLDLSPLRSPEAVLPALAQTVRAHGAVEETLQDQEVLLVLDNAEHVVDAAPDLGTILGACGAVSMLVTSREPLHLGFERELPLHPMPETPAVELFRQRAQMVDPDFDGEYAVLADICARLDGLPLAIELAAARVKVLGASGLLERLDRRLPLLTGRSRDAPERQRTLRATIEWSYDLLDGEEQRVFAAVSAFVGGFTLEAAEAVAGADLDTLESLVEKSMLRQEEGRLSMLGTIREFALERLDASPTADEIRARHADHFLGVAEAAAATITDSADPQSLEPARADLVAAFEWLTESGDHSARLRLAAAMVSFWALRGPAAEGERWARIVLDGPTEPGPELSQVLSGAGWLAMASGDYAEGERLSAEAARVAREVGDRYTLGHALRDLARCANQRGDSELGLELAEEAREHFRAIGARRGEASVLHNMAYAAWERGEVERARELLEAELEVGATKYPRAIALLDLGQIALWEGRTVEAGRHLRAALKAGSAEGATSVIGQALSAFAGVAAAKGDLRGAALLLGASDAVAERMGGDLFHEPLEHAVRARATAAVRAELSPNDLERIREEGRRRPESEAVAYALSFD